VNSSIFCTSNLNIHQKSFDYKIKLMACVNFTELEDWSQSSARKLLIDLDSK